MPTTNQKLIQAKQLAEIIKSVNLHEPYLDFYGKNFDLYTEKETIASSIRLDVLKIINLFEKSFFKNRQISIEDYTLCSLRRQIFLKQKQREHSANAKMPITRTMVDRIRKGIVKANFSLKANALTSEYKNTVEAVQSAINRCYSSSNGRKVLMDVLLSAILNWNWYLKSQFKTPKERIANIKDPEIKKYVKMSDTYAKMEYISEFELFFDPLLAFKDQRFIVYRSIKPLKSILKTIETLDEKIDEEHLNYVIANPKPFSKKDYSQIRLIKYLWVEAARRWENYNIDNIYNITFNNDKCEYVEIWTPDTISICINGWIVADTENPYKWRDYPYPFYDCHFSDPAWGWSIAEWVGIILADMQKGYDNIFNLLLDHANMAWSPMIWVQAGKVIFNNKSVDHKLQREPRWVLEMEDKWNMDFVTPPPLDQWLISLLQDMLEMANFAVSPTSYSDYTSQSRSAQDSQLRFEWLADSVSLLVDSVSNMLNQVAYNWLLDMSEKMPDLFEIPIYTSDWRIKEWKKINKENLEWKYLFEWWSDSIADVNDMLNKSQLQEFIWYLTRIGIPWDWSTYLDIPNLLKYINGLYKWPWDIIRDESVYYSKFEEDQKKKAEIQSWVQQIQAAWEADAQQIMQEKQLEWQAELQEQQQSLWLQQWQEQWPSPDKEAQMQAVLQQMMWQQ